MRKRKGRELPGTLHTHAGQLRRLRETFDRRFDGVIEDLIKETRDFVHGNSLFGTDEGYDGVERHFPEKVNHHNYKKLHGKIPSTSQGQYHVQAGQQIIGVLYLLSGPARPWCSVPLEKRATHPEAGEYGCCVDLDDGGRIVKWYRYYDGLPVDEEYRVFWKWGPGTRQ